MKKQKKQPGGSGPLQVHEITPEDAAIIRTLAGAQFADKAAVTLPSGRTVTGAEINQWTEEQK